jgi:endonuclease-3 related protein
MIAPERLLALEARLAETHGAMDGWWPAASPFEVMVGAVLVQNTRWEAAVRAIEALRSADALTPEGLLALGPEPLERLVRPSGTYRIKAARLRALARAVAEAGGLAGLEALDDPALRARLLAVRGIGPETADAILNYAFGRPAFVVDAYARRCLERLGLLARAERVSYSAIAEAVRGIVGDDAARLAALHAYFVTHARTVCRKVPQCARCTLARRCPFPLKTFA